MRKGLLLCVGFGVLGNRYVPVGSPTRASSGLVPVGVVVAGHAWPRLVLWPVGPRLARKRCVSVVGTRTHAAVLRERDYGEW